LLEALAKPYEQKVARFSNGDILVGGSPLTGETSDQNGGLNMARLDACGNVRWAMNYQWKKNYMKCKDVKINEAQEIFIYGTAFESPNNEYIFLLQLNNKGNVLRFKVYHGGTVDNFTYNIQIKDNKILAYGLLLEYSTPKRGFLAMFDDQLNYKWCKVFQPFESFGEAIITEDNGFLGRSGFYHIKLNADGSLHWAKELKIEAGSGLYPIAGPLAVKDGFIFEAIQDGNAFFYKMDANGNFRWKSDAFPATPHPADMTLLSDGNILATYICPGDNENFPCQLLLNSAGNIIHQQKLFSEPPLKLATIYHSIDAKKRLIHIIGNTDVLAANGNKPSGFLLQYALDSLHGRCFQWDQVQNITSNVTTVQFEPIEMAFFEPRFTNIEASITTTKWNFNFSGNCDKSDINLISLDTLLSCGQNWQVRLPNTNFRWEDEVVENPRTLEKPGVYRASDYNCISPVTYEYHFQRTPCQCNVFLPTAFSPNYDGLNEKLELFSSCTIHQIQFSVYNRWGDKVFSSNELNASWDGKSNQKTAEPGLYVAVIRYQILNDSNEIEEGSIVQNVQLVR